MSSQQDFLLSEAAPMQNQHQKQETNNLIRVKRENNNKE
jgi:hypothetical protein